MNYTPDNITQLEDNQIFVFGSNLAGKHGLGAAKIAKDKFGAVYGIGKGICGGQCYAFPTKDWEIQSLTLLEIKNEFGDLIDCCNKHPEKEFLLTKVGCGLAGFSVAEIAPLLGYFTIPPNLILPKEFWSNLVPF